MAQETSEYPRNVPGKYWVEQDICLAHVCCADEAPHNFVFEQFIARVFKQPENLEEDQQCRNAMNCCPMGAIHDDGETNPEARKYAAG